MIFGELRVVDDVPEAFARLVAAAVRDHESSTAHFRLGCSGGSSGAQCFSRLAEEDLPWSSIECFFADERCVDPESSDANAVAIAAALGRRRDELAAYHAMSCSDGPEAYAALIEKAGGFDLLQLGIGPDGHTASLFPASNGADAPKGALVIRNADPTGLNKFDRMSLTYEAIAMANLVVITAMGADKADALKRVEEGEDLPVGRVRAEKVIWLVDRDAAGGLVSPASS